jgi:hypothetical protein
MNTRKTVYIAVAAVSGLLWACSDDILDKKPLNGYSEVDVFADEALLRDYVNGTYRSIRFPFDDENSLTDGLTDNAYNQHGSAESTIKIYTRAEVSQDDGEGVTRNLWTQAYAGIRRVNLFFEKTQDSDLDAEALKTLGGQMQFLRAYLYFDLLRWYGSVPLITKTYGLNESYEVTRASYDEIVNFIVTECNDAITKLPSMTDAGYSSGVASVEAAMALKARTLLYAASALYNTSADDSKWTAARDANKAVMDLAGVSLAGNATQYGAMFRGTNANEVIFARYFTQTNNQGWGVNVWLFPNSNGGWATTTPTQNLVDDYELTNGLLPSEAGSGYNDQNPYVNRDPRFYETILYNGASFKGGVYSPYRDKTYPDSSLLAGKDSRFTISTNSPHNASKTGYNFRKWSQESEAWDAGNKGPWIIFRLSEFYLNYAEAQIELENYDEARNAINAIRSRFGMPDVTESGDELKERYRRERRIELALEDHRFFDIRRWKIGPESLDKPALGVDVYKAGASFDYIYGMVADNTRKWDDKMYFLPIPATEIQRSNNSLTQNSGY